MRAYARYLCHLDNPEKAQYEVAEGESLGGADYLGTIKCAADTDTALGEMRWTGKRWESSWRSFGKSGA